MINPHHSKIGKWIGGSNMLKIGNRSIGKVLTSVLEKRHWIAFGNMVVTYKNFPSVFMRYFFVTGKYPYKISVKSIGGGNVVLPR